MKVRSPYNYDRDAASVASGLLLTEPSVTQQSFKEECDINVLMDRFGVTGEMPAVIKTPLQGDFTAVTDFQSALNLIRESQEAFMTVPAKVRDMFANDPGRFLDFVSNPANIPRMVEMGLGRVQSPSEPRSEVTPTPTLTPAPSGAPAAS